MDGCDDCSLSYGAGALSIQAMSPIILVHGIFSDGSWFTANQFTTPLINAGVPFATATFAASSIENSGAKLVAAIPSLAQEFGVSKVHIVAHSKGGIWSRYFLANGPISTDTYAPPTPNNFGILSLITLDTPNNGSILASFVTGSIDVASLLTMEAGPEASVVLAVVLQLASGYLDQITDLTRDEVEIENSELNAPPDSFEDTDGTVYYIFYGAVAADADIGDKQDTSGNRYVDSTDCAGMWALGFPLNVNVCKALYWLMGNEGFLSDATASLSSRLSFLIPYFRLQRYGRNTT
jgi:pimeloyl-ACP methyl ester carboxylesterase